MTARLIWLAVGIVGCAESLPAASQATPPVPTTAACGEWAVQDEGAYLARQTAVPGATADCETALHAVAGAAGSSISIELSSLPSAASATVEITDLLGEVLVAGELTQGASLQVPLERTGEHLVRITPDAPTTYELTTTCATGCDLEWTRYPIILMHGAGGTDSYLNLFGYWWTVVDVLEPAGYAVYVDTVDPFQASEVRGAEWAEHLQGLVDSGYARRFNLVGHSQGGLDARYVASQLDLEHRVVSVTTIQTPHRGNSLFDPLTTDVGALLTDPALNLVSAALGLMYGVDDQDYAAQLVALSAVGMEEFNSRVPDRADVHYASWGGHTCATLDLGCQFDLGGEVITPFLSAPQAALELLEGPCDGLVSVESAKWGEYRGTVIADHLDVLGMPFGQYPSFDLEAFYLDEARYLHDQGF